MKKRNMKSLIVITQMTTRRTASIDSYFREVNKYDLITPEREVELMEAYMDGDESAGDELILANLRFVVSVAKQYSGYGMPLADLISAGNYGLIKAVKKFDHTKGFKFISYAVWWIRQAILAELAANGRTIRLPLNVISANSKHKKITGEDMPEVTALQVGSLNHKIGDDMSMEVADVMESKTFAPPDEVIANKPAIHYYVEKLPPRERDIVKMRYGIGYKAEHTYDEISMELDLTRERIRQIHVNALKRLRHLIRNVNPEILYEREPRS